MNDAAVQKQISNMVSFIAKEAEEKASEIRTKADEEFTLEKARIVQSQKHKIAAEYAKKEQQVLVNKKIAHSNELAKARLQILKARETGMQRLLEQAKLQLDAVAASPAYRALLVRLIVQGLVKLDAPHVEVKARAEDRELVLSVLDEAAAAYTTETGKQATLALAKDTLPPSPKNAGPKALATCSGGVILSAEGRITCDNTLDVRLRLAYEHSVPDIRKKLFDNVRTE